MSNFWKYQIRYRVARWMIHAGLFIWPPGRGKAELMDMLWAWRHDIETTLHQRS